MALNLLGCITLVVVIWGIFLLITPVFGRIGCGWFCFMGTVLDIASQHSIFRIKWNKPIIWIRLIIVLAFFTTAFIFLILRYQSGIITEIKIDLWLLKMDFSPHYKHVWLYDTMGAVCLGLLLERRWAFRNLCFMGTLCSSGTAISRLIPVVDINKCDLCGKCESDCLVRIPITKYVKKNCGLITNSECILCGKCIDSCKRNALKIKLIWNRKKYIENNVQQDIPERVAGS